MFRMLSISGAVGLLLLLGSTVWAQSPSFGASFSPLGGGIVNVSARMDVAEGLAPQAFAVGARVDVALGFADWASPSVGLSAFGRLDVAEGVHARLGVGPVLVVQGDGDARETFLTWNVLAGLGVDVVDHVDIVLEAAALPSLGAIGVSLGVEVRP